MNDAGKIAYEAARNEILLRIRLREQILLFFLAIVGALLGVTYNKSATIEILLIIPIIGLAVSFLFSQHTISIASLAHFCRVELNKEFNNTPHWDNSNVLRFCSEKQLKLRSYATTLIILIPSIFALVITLPHSYQISFPLGPLWWFSAICLVISAIDCINSYKFRTMIYKIKDWNASDLIPNKENHHGSK